MATQTYQLTMRTGPNAGRIHKLGTGETTIGRDPGNSITIADPEISRRHARLTRQDEYYLLEDLNSTNGTFVNGRRLVGQYVLQPGDVINLGENITLLFEIRRYDPDATVVSPSVYPEPETPEPYSEPRSWDPGAPKPKPTGADRRAPAQQTPGSPTTLTSEGLEPMPEPQSRNRALPWVLAGCGCFTIVCLAGFAAIWYIDANFLWCQLFPFIPGCP
jgi:pSer/pThr/pTyr-binding forkhead associated (FHA) protein